MFDDLGTELRVALLSLRHLARTAIATIKRFLGRG